MFELMDAYTQNAVIKVIGIGGGGGNAVQHMVSASIEGVDFICANTDAQALKNTSARTVLQLGSHITKGLGAGANPDMGRQAALRGSRAHHRSDRRRRHGVHHRGHGRRHRHRRGAGRGAGRQGTRHPDGRGGDQAVSVRRQQAHADRQPRHQGAEPVRRFADHHPQREAAHGTGQGRSPAGRVQGRQQRAAGRGAGHRRADHPSGPHQRRLRRRAHGDVGDGHGDDGLR